MLRNQCRSIGGSPLISCTAATIILNLQKFVSNEILKLIKKKMNDDLVPILNIWLRLHSEVWHDNHS